MFQSFSAIIFVEVQMVLHLASESLLSWLQSILSVTLGILLWGSGAGGSS